MNWSIIATWDFSAKGIEKASEILENMGNVFDAIEKTIVMVEDDSTVTTVGYGGVPNICGEVELDAAFMDGGNMAVGAVGALKGFKNPIKIAKKIMADCQYNFLVGQGAEDFARVNNFKEAIMITDDTKKFWKEKKAAVNKNEVFGHDTIGVIAMDNNRNVACGTSTSGTSIKYRGRIGDSPLIGSGFYVDNEVGGAVATGIGDVDRAT